MTKSYDESNSVTIALTSNIGSWEQTVSIQQLAPRGKMVQAPSKGSTFGTSFQVTIQMLLMT